MMLIKATEPLLIDGSLLPASAWQLGPAKNQNDTSKLDSNESRAIDKVGIQVFHCTIP